MGKGGSSTTAEIPEWLEDAARRNLNQADRISRIGSLPMSYGPTVAAFTPMQNSSFNNTANMASAFGLDLPTGTAVTGGMDAPTTYANGVSAYSALPIYNQTMEDFRLDRPGQSSYIDSFFIDPFSGQPGSNVAPIMNNPMPIPAVGPGVGGSNSGGVGQERADFMANHMARQQRNFADGVTANPSFGYAQDDKGGVVALGYEGGQVDPSLARAAGYTTIKDKNPFDMTFGEHFSQMKSDVSEMPGQIKKDVDDATVMCTAYYEMGMLPKEIWNLDRRYGVRVLRSDPLLMEGYHVWGMPTANFIRKKTFFAGIVRSIMWPIVKAWAEEMAHCMKPNKYKANYFGKAIKFLGEPFSRLVGKIYKYQIRLSGRRAEV
jgi:hypothetical protein